MRSLVSIAVVTLLLLGAARAFSVAAQEGSLADLLPAASEIGGDFAEVDRRTRTLDEQATGFANPVTARQRLAAWNWQGNAFLVLQSTALTADGTPVATIDVSLTHFADAEAAAQALAYFLEDRAAMLGEREAPIGTPIGDEARLLTSAADQTVFTRTGPLVIRVSVTAPNGTAALTPQQVAQQIVSRFATWQQPAVVERAIDAYLPQSLQMGGGCARMDGEDETDIPALLERYDGVRNAAETLAAMGWQEGANRQFACDEPAAGGVGWVNLSILRFADAAAAADAVDFLAEARAAVTNLDPAQPPALGERSAALAGPGVNGTEHTLFFSSGPLLFRVTGVGPQGDPRSDVEAIATALYQQRLAAPAELLPAPTPQTLSQPTSTPVSLVTATPFPTPSPMPTVAPLPTATAVPPTATSVPTTIPVVIPTATPSPVPTAAPAEAPTTIPVVVPTSPPPAPTTAPSGPAPTPTPRVIRPPTPTSE